MRDKPLSCEQAEALMADADAAPELGAHLAECDRCLDAFLDRGLRRPPSESVPAGFAARAALRIERDRRQVELRAAYWATLAACLLFALLAGWVVSSGALLPLLDRIPSQPPNVLALGAIAVVEVALIFGWLWRLSRVEDYPS
jgi:hypothetical protein